MRIAYLIAASGNYLHLERLIAALEDEGVHFFLHIDAKSPMPDNLGGRNNVTFVHRRRIWWGGFSQVAATLDMMRAAVAGGYDYYAYISGGDYPVRPNAHLAEILSEGGQFIDAAEGFAAHKPRKRIRNYYLDCFDRRRPGVRRWFFRNVERAISLVAHKRSYPFTKVWHGSSWWLLSRGAVSYILDYVQGHHRFVRFYKTSLCPDESFFQTVLALSPFVHEIKGNLTYVSWRQGESGPDFITEGHLPFFAPGAKSGMKRDFFFARKFDDQSGEVVKKIDELYRK